MKKKRSKLFDEEHLGKQINSILRNVSGKVDSPDPLVDFLYTLMRDHMVPGQVEKLVREVEDDGAKIPISYSNRFLASYAISLAQRPRKKTK